MATPISGFKFLFPTTRDDTCVIYIPTTGVFGVLGRKREIFVTKKEAFGMEKTLLFETPAWFVETGQQITRELSHWAIAGKPLEL